MTAWGLSGVQVSIEDVLELLPRSDVGGVKMDTIVAPDWIAASDGHGRGGIGDQLLNEGRAEKVAAARHKHPLKPPRQLRGGYCGSKLLPKMQADLRHECAILV
jgi:hypothetical protein